MKRIILYSLFFLFLSPVVFAQNHSSRINPEVQLQDNGWIKILGHSVEEYFPDFQGGEAPLDIDGNKLKFYHLKVHIQFLKYCQSSKEESDLTEQGLSQEEFLRRLKKEMKNLGKIKGPEFKCNYRNKIFVSYFDKNGHEVFTTGKYPEAPSEGFEKVQKERFGKMVGSLETIYKSEIFPGEKIDVTFPLHTNYSSWHVWVPK